MPQQNNPYRSLMKELLKLEDGFCFCANLFTQEEWKVITESIELLGQQILSAAKREVR